MYTSRTALRSAFSEYSQGVRRAQGQALITELITKDMSVNENTIWLENAYENFLSAIEAKNYPVAKAVIADVRERGFTSEANTMQDELYASQDSRTSNILLRSVLWFLKNKQKLYQSQGLIPTLELVIEDLEAELNK